MFLLFIMKKTKKKQNYVKRIKMRKKRPRVLETISMRNHSGLNHISMSPYILQREIEQNFNTIKILPRINDLTKRQHLIETKLDEFNKNRNDRLNFSENTDNNDFIETQLYYKTLLQNQNNKIRELETLSDTNIVISDDESDDESNDFNLDLLVENAQREVEVLTDGVTEINTPQQQGVSFSKIGKEILEGHFEEIDSPIRTPPLRRRPQYRAERQLITENAVDIGHSVRTYGVAGGLRPPRQQPRPTQPIKRFVSHTKF